MDGIEIDSGALEAAYAAGDYDAVLLELRNLHGAQDVVDIHEQAEIAMAMADDQVAAGRFDLADRILERVLKEIERSEHWAECDTDRLRLTIVRLADQRAALKLETGAPEIAMRYSDMATEFADGIDGPYDQVSEARADLYQSAKQQLNGGFEKPVALQDVSLHKSYELAEATPRASQSLEEVSFEDLAASGMESAAPEGFEAQADKPYFEVPIHFATHRDRTGRKNPYDYYRGKRSELSFGKALVTVPKDRRPGEFRRASRRNAASANKMKLITIDSVEGITDREILLEDLQAAISGSNRREALLFIHGFNTSFAGGLMRAAQLSVDLDINGATVLYSWPSRGSVISYFVDRNEKTDLILQDLRKLLVDIAQKTGAERFHVLAHSMGSEYLLDALADALTVPGLNTPETKPLIDELIFASPDVDANNFSERLPRVRHLAKRITAYTSDRDRALLLSKQINGRTRAGTAPELISKAGCDAIDTTKAAQDFIGHDDFSSTAIDDVRTLIWSEIDLPPERRAAILEPDESGLFWRFFKSGSELATEVFREALRLIRRDGFDGALELLNREKSVKVPGSNWTVERIEQLERQITELAGTPDAQS